jgi:hypothetical protein
LNSLLATPSSSDSNQLNEREK